MPRKELKSIKKMMEESAFKRCSAGIPPYKDSEFIEDLTLLVDMADEEKEEDAKVVAGLIALRLVPQIAEAEKANSIQNKWYIQLVELVLAVASTWYVAISLGVIRFL